jgi:hypothetical protein
MAITELLVKTLLLKLNQPSGYKVELTSVVMHGKGYVITYEATDPSGAVGYRAAGFVIRRGADHNLACTFDMIVS